jgi:hypothetical protein
MKVIIAEYPKTTTGDFHLNGYSTCVHSFPVPWVSSELKHPTARYRLASSRFFPAVTGPNFDSKPQEP